MLPLNDWWNSGKSKRWKSIQQDPIQLPQPCKTKSKVKQKRDSEVINKEHCNTFLAKTVVELNLKLRSAQINPQTLKMKKTQMTK